MFYDTKDTIHKIMGAWGGFPEESAWIEYKSACDFSSAFRDGIRCEVTAFLNSIQRFNREKFILFGIEEDKKTKKKILTGLKNYKFPEDNEWQNVFGKIKPIQPNIETGTYDYHGLLFGYIYIPSENYYGPYRCPQKGSSKDAYWIRRGGNKCPDMTDDERERLIQLSKDALKAGKTFQKSRESLVMATIGKYDCQNENDKQLIEESAGETLEVFHQHCLIQDSAMVQPEDSLYGITRHPVSHVEDKHSRLMQFSPDDVTAAIKIIKTVLEHPNIWYSDDLLDGVMDTLAFLSCNGFSAFTRNMIRSTITADIFQHTRYASRIGCLAEADPEFMLELMRGNLVEYFCQPDCRNAAVVQALQAIAWFPEYYEQAVQLLWALRKNDALYGLLHWAPIATAASFQQKLQMIRKIANSDPERIFDILNRILYYNPNCPAVYPVEYHTPLAYQRFLEGTHSEDISKLQTYYGELLDVCGNKVENILKLLDRWLQPFPFSNLDWLADHVKAVEPNITDPAEREKLWNRLCNTPLVFITDQPVDGELKEKLTAVGRLFQPANPYADSRQWFRSNIEHDLCIGGRDYEAIREEVQFEQKKALLTLYRQGGINQVISFLVTVPIQPYPLAQLLTSPELALTEEDDKVLLSAFFDAPENYSYYFQIKCSRKGLPWLKKLGVEELDCAKQAVFFSALAPDAEILSFIMEQMGADAKQYWSLAEPRTLTECLQTAFEQFMNCGLPEKAFELFQYPYRLDKLPPQWLLQCLLSLREYDSVPMPGDVFAKVYHTLSGQIDGPALEELEELSFERYGDRMFAHGIQVLTPHVTFRRLVNEPETFLAHIKSMNEPYSFAERLLSHCGAVPDQLQGWLDGIDLLCASEPESVRTKAEYWMGYILYNKLRKDEGGYILDEVVSEALERSEQKRNGFLQHAYYGFQGYHTNGNFANDVQDRECAEHFEALATVQEISGNMKFAECLHLYAKQLIADIESIL